MGLAPYGEPRYADADPREAGRPQGRRLVPDGHELLQLLPGPDDDLAEVRRPVRRAAAAAGVAADPARDGPGRLDPGGDRGDHAAHGPARPRADRDEEPLPGRRRGAQLRRQRPDPARGAVREHLDPAGGRRRRRGARASPSSSGTSCSATSGSVESAGRRSTARCSGRASPTSRSARSSTSAARCTTTSTTRESSSGGSSTCIAQEKVVGWFQGRMEFGPRALGGRSILGDARSRAMQSVMNLKIKFRESFRPFAPIVLRERVSEYFEMRDEEDSPYMLLVAPVTESQAAAGRRRRRPGPRQAQGRSGPRSRRSPTSTTRPASRRSTPSATAALPAA